MKHTAVTCNMPVIDLLQKVAWPLYAKYEDEEGDEEEGHALDGLNQILLDESLLDEYELEDSVRECLLKEIKHRLAEQPFKIQAQIEVTCFTGEGILAIKEALNTGKVHAEEKNQKLEVNLLSTPTYRLITQCTDKQHGIDIVNSAIDVIQAAIKEREGNFLLKEAPQEV